MGNNILSAFVYLFAALAFIAAVGAASFGFSELYGFAGLAGCLAAFITIVQRTQ